MRPSLLAVHTRQQGLPAPLAQGQPALAGRCLQLRQLLLAHLRAQSLGAERGLHHAAPPWETADSQSWKSTGITSLLPKPISPMVSQRNQQIDVRKPSVDSRRGISLELLCFQQVYVQLPQVAVQHPFWADVSPCTPCAARPDSHQPGYRTVTREPDPRQAPRTPASGSL